MSLAPALQSAQPPSSPQTGPVTRPQYEFVGADSAKVATVIATLLRLLQSGVGPALVGALLPPSLYNGSAQVDVIPDSPTLTPIGLHVGDRNVATGDYGFILYANGTSSGIQAVIANVRNTIWFGGAFINKVKAGIPADGDFPAVQDGMCVLDTADNRIYFRSGGVWRYATLT
jgi:hypothetical protein